MAMASALSGFGLGVFEDQVYSSTDLQRRAGEVFNSASEGPVTISRSTNNHVEQFALLRRELAAQLVAANNLLHTAVVALISVQHMLCGGEPAPSFAWLKIYEKDDLVQFQRELSVAIEGAVADGSWRIVKTLIHEWQESAEVAANGLLDAVMFNEESDEQEIPRPSSPSPE